MGRRVLRFDARFAGEGCGGTLWAQYKVRRLWIAHGATAWQGSKGSEGSEGSEGGGLPLRGNGVYNAACRRRALRDFLPAGNMVILSRRRKISVRAANGPSIGKCRSARSLTSHCLTISLLSGIQPAAAKPAVSGKRIAVPLSHYFTSPLNSGAMTWPSPSQGAKVS